MTFFANKLLFVGFFIVVLGCSTSSKIDALKPEPEDAAPLVYDNSPSFIKLPVTIPLKDIENKINTMLNGLIYEDHNIEDDDIEMKIWKQSAINVRSVSLDAENKIKMVLPLKVWIKYRLGTEKMGVSLYNTKEFNFNGVVTLLSDVDLNLWKLNTKTELKSLEWNESPSIVVFGKNMPITYLANSGFLLFKSKIAKKIDDALNDSMDFKPNVIDALSKLTEPFKISEKYATWFQINPIELYSSPMKLNQNAFVVSIGMKCTMETKIGSKPSSKFDKNTLLLKTNNTIANEVNASIAGVSSYSDASKIIMANFSGQELRSGSKKVTIKNVNMWQKNNKMVVSLEVLGSVNGTLYLSGIPKYNEKTYELFFDRMEYALDTKNALLKTANWLAQEIILKKIENHCRFSIKSNLDEGKKNIETYLNNYSPTTGVFVNGKINSFTFDKVQLTNQAIIAFLKIKGFVAVNIDGLK